MANSENLDLKRLDEPKASTNFNHQIYYQNNFDKIDAAMGAAPSTLTTDAKTLVPAINELKSDKVDKVTGKGLSTNDYTTTEKNKLAGIPADTAAQLADIVKQTNYLKSDDLFASAFKTVGFGYHTGSLTQISNALFGIVDIPVSKGDIVSLSGWRNMNPYGYVLNNISDSRITAAPITGDGLIEITQENTGRLRITYYISDVANLKIYKYGDKLKQASVLSATADQKATTNLTSINAINKKIDITSINKPYMIKNFDESLYISGLRYLAFFSGCMWNGFEYHVARIGQGHLPGAVLGKLVFHKIDANGNIEVVYPALQSVVGELRDPNVTISRSNQYMYLSAFGYENGAMTKSYLFILDSSLTEIARSEISLTKFIWGNTIETADGYLLKTAYDMTEHTISLYKSNEKITETTALTFSIVHTFSVPGIILTESTLSICGNKLVFITRCSTGTRIAYTETLDGSGGWSAFTVLSPTIHCPVMPVYQEGNVIIFGGGLVLSGSSRKPCIAFYDLATGSLKNLSVIDNDVTEFGGYPSMIPLGGDTFAMMYYSDYQNARTKVDYQRVNVHYKCNTAYFMG